MTIQNAGHAFTRCVRCAADLVEAQGRWQTAPKGFRIVWKQAGKAAEEAPGAGSEVETLEFKAEALDPEAETLDLEAETLELEAETPELQADALELAADRIEVEVDTGEPEVEALGLEAEILDLEMEAVLDRAMADETPEFPKEPAPVPPPAPERRGVERRAPPGTQPKFTGVDRRRGDRRGSFGRNRRQAQKCGGPEPVAEVQYDLI